MTIRTEAPEGARVLDLEAARAARAEARVGQPLPVVKLSAGYIDVKPEIDLLCVEDLKAGRFREGLARLLADPDDVDTLLSSGLTDADALLLTKFVTGQEPGESSASPTS